LSKCTIVVPHYAVSKVCRPGQVEPPIQTTKMSPKTLVYGKHAASTAAILEANGVSTKVVDSFEEIRAAAAQKLIWASCMWLLCHSSLTTSQSSMSCTVVEIHQYHQLLLDQLVDELVPALYQIVGDRTMKDENFGKKLGSYLTAYSQSIPNAIPSKELALAELEERNGVWLTLRSMEYPQSLHQQLIAEVAGKEALQTALLRE
jgi:hypothetical protein